MTFGKPVKILRCCFTVLVSSVLVDLLKGQSVHHAGSYAPLPQLTIINGTDAVISEDQDGFVYCYASFDSGGRRRSPYKVLWTDPYGLPLFSYPRVDVKTAKIFTVREAFVPPHSYLVFRGFDDGLAGMYTCNLIYGGRLLARRSIHLRLFRPSFRVVPLPPCLAVPEGGTLLLPSPVLGNPPKPPLWSKVDGDLDPSTTLLLNGGLLLQEVQGEIYYQKLFFFSDRWNSDRIRPLVLSLCRRNCKPFMLLGT